MSERKLHNFFNDLDVQSKPQVREEANTLCGSYLAFTKFSMLLGFVGLMNLEVS